ncbi:hypothetical protein CLCOS_12320 [Clostridium coskatii]|uniref:Uncharacterized protein n=1 Tax=Clostridium coskatii TaxID=1705578 RepID=A0A166SWC7_9CLOT|nr:hypothetical protein WX73_00526 [Clostridium coskatii]OBR95799.1 hypothetical protein CLCOS_12320 [Clostridium coskatii]
MDKQNPLNENLERGLQERHIQFLAHSVLMLANL